MGGRGASSGISVRGKSYGSEHETLMTDGNIKYVRYLDSTAAKTPQETMTRGRVYATVNVDNQVIAITYYDSSGKRKKSIDLLHEHMGLRPHTHEGYNHAENGTHRLTAMEKALVDRVMRTWYNKHSK